MSFPLETIDPPSPEPPGHRNPDMTTPIRPTQLSPSLSGECMRIPGSTRSGGPLLALECPD